MNREDRERMVDRLLNEALAPHDIEPRAGLEERIIAGLRARPEPRPWWRWMWVPAAAAAVLLVIALKPSRTTQPAPAPVVVERRPVETPALQPKSPATAGVPRKPAPLPAPARVVVASGSRQDEPRLAVFPSPVPLTPEEQLLMALAQRNRSEALLVARNQEDERERVQKFFATGEAPPPEPITAPNTR